jgi:putative heme transporter
VEDPKPPGPDGEQVSQRSGQRRIASAAERRLAWVSRRRRERSEEQIAERTGRQWAQHLSEQLAQVRVQREVPPHVEPVVPSGVSNFSRAQVPYGVDLAAAWSWRFLVIIAAGWVVAQGVQTVTVVLLPLVVALFLAALAGPVADLLGRVMPRSIASLLVVVGLLGLVTLMLTFATQQVVDGFTDISEQVVTALDRIQDWLRNGPLGVSDQQVSNLLEQMQELVATSNEQIVTRVTEVGSTVGQIVAGFFLVLFALFFFMYDGSRIWTWVVRLFPRAARSRADSAGRVAWLSLTQFVRATVMVAAVDAIGIMIVAAVLQVPFVMAIGVLVFLGGFVPIIGATLTGLIAVLVALVAQGPLIALFMLLGVVGVQQLESNVLQPFLLGRMVAIHPLAVILAVATGVLVAGVAGALVAVPIAACVNAAVVHLAGESRQAVTDETAVLTDHEEEHDPDRRQQT